MTRRVILRLAALALWATLAAPAAPLPAQAKEKEHVQPSSTDRPVISAGRFEQVSEGEMLLSGDVDLRYGELRLLADQVRYDEPSQRVSAEGNVVLMIGKSQISGDRLEMNVQTRLATIWNAHGYLDPDVIFQAERLERVAEDKVLIIDGTVTTCTQPTPYWAFHVTSALLHLDHYAHMRNVALKVEKAPIIYLPYLLWPMKRERATGLLLPNVGYSRTRGSFIGNALYVVMGRSQDATIFYDLYGKTGTGVGYEYRFVPAPRGAGVFTGYYLSDTITDPNSPDEGESRTRYRFKLVEAQKFANGYRFLADLNSVSDLDYYLDFERDITQTTSPIVFSHIDLVRNWSAYSLNVRADRQEQFISETENLTLQRLPEVEMRGRGIRFGRTPIYLSFETSGGVYNRDQRFEVVQDPLLPADPNNTEAERLEVTYQRFDLFPTISASFSPTSWLDISPAVSARETYYSNSVVDPNDPRTPTSGESITREFTAFSLSLVGPRFFRLFGDPKRNDITVYKHTFEPHVLYTYIPEVTDGEKVIRFDEIDTLTDDLNQVTYSLTSRLFARRPAAAPKAPAAETEPAATDIAGPTQVSTPVIDVKDLPEAMKQALKDEAQAPAVGAVEVASFDLSQSYSFDRGRPLSRAMPVEPDGTPGELVETQLGPVIATARYNPTAATNISMRADYDILFDDLRSVSVSADMRSVKHGYLRLSWFLNRDFNGASIDPDPVDPNNPLERSFFDSSQIRLLGGSAFWQRKVTLDLEGSYDIETRELRDQRYRLGYSTQCCGMLFELARRNFDTVDEIEYRFTLNLRGVGTFLDLQGRPR